MSGAMAGGRISRWRPRFSLRAVALASLGLNLFLAAMLAASWMRPGPPPPRPMPDRYLDRVMPELSEADGRRLRAAFDALRPRYEALDQEYHLSSQTTRALLATEPYDAVATRAAAEQARAKRRQIAELTEETVLSLLPDLSPAGRMRLMSPRRGF